MQRTLRGVARFSGFGFTKSRMARKLWVRAGRETSAQTGRPIADSVFFVGDILVSVRFPEFLFYGILARVFESRNDCREKDNRPICTGSAVEGWNWALRGKRLEEALRNMCVTTDSGVPNEHAGLSCAKARRRRAAALQNGAEATVVRRYEKRGRCNSYMSSGANCEKASGAASSKRVRRLRKTKRTLSVGPLRCLATWISA